jgi:ribosome-associated protein
MTEPQSLQQSTLERSAEPVRTGGGVDDPRALALRIAQVADDLKAQDITLLNVANAVGYADWFVIATGNTDRQTKAIHDSVLKAIKDDLRIVPKRVEGVTEATWILMDYLDVVLHVFTPDARDFYRLERLYGDVPRESFGTPN